MKKILLILGLICGLHVDAEAQKKTNDIELLFDIRSRFITEWSYFRMQKNPLLTYEETHTEWGAWKRPDQVIGVIPDTFFTKDYEPDIKIYRWEDIYKRSLYCEHCEQVRNPFFYVIEKGDGITGIRHNVWTNEILDTLQLNVYDSIFPYDNRFLIYNPEYENPNKFIFYSGNVDWIEPFFNSKVTIVGAAKMRGVQFGLEYVARVEQKITDSLRKLRPEYPDYVYATADESFISRGRILVAGHENSISDYIEFIFYSDDSIKTGDSKGIYYEMRYLLPSNIKSITERRMVKRKLTEEEQNKMLRSYLRKFRDMTREMEEEEFIKTMESEAVEE
ncbi:MAG: hypothetical protein LBK94_13100 [Prevotellaceae bacterium]|jgi:hypothetical protein|nr:hypothetical protein [Prevotellaceae bacterium]